MIGIYAVIAVGIALIIGFIPLLSKKFREGDFLIGHYIDKSLMTQAEKEECIKLGFTAFMKKVDKEIKEKRENARWRQKRR